MSLVLKRSVLAPIEKALAAWYDREPSGGGVAILLCLFVAIWTLFQIISYASIDLHPDPLEVFAWSRHPSAGYFKHPPLGAWIAAIWFAVLPRADWAFQLLGNVNAAVGLYAIYLLARRYLGGDKRLLVLLLLLLTPFYQFNAQRFASNQTLLSTWPLATYCFLVAFERRTVFWSLAAGCMGALAMLGKYFSIYLIAGFAVAALMHPRRADYFRSPSPWISSAVGALVLAPHIYWLVTTGYQPFAYALGAHSSATFMASGQAVLNYAVGGVAYMGLPLLVYWLALRPDPATIKAALWPIDPDMRMLALLLVVPLALPTVVAMILRAELVPLWTMQGWFLLPILLLRPATAVFSRAAGVKVAIAVLAVSLAVLLAAPALAWMRHSQGTNEGRAYFRPVVSEITSLWHETTGRPLAIVVGEFGAPATFYSSDRPDYMPNFNFALTPWITPERFNRDGWAIACAVGDLACRNAVTARIASRTDARSVEVEIVPRFLGIDGERRRYVIVLVPPGPSTAFSRADELQRVSRFQ
jgi:4-amino-4-deoxy-L-arabinose transferase-like glycosyltransferase